MTPVEAQALWIGATILIGVAIYAVWKVTRPPKIYGWPAFGDVLGDWPNVTKVEKVPPAYKLTGAYLTPTDESIDWLPFVLSALLAGGAAAAWCNDAVIACVGLAAEAIIGFPVWVDSLNTWLVIDITATTIQWQLPNGKTYTAAPSDLPAVVRVPHRKAAATQRQHDAIARMQAGIHAARQQRLQREQAERGNKKRNVGDDFTDLAASSAPVPPRPTYQIASELIIHAGPGGRDWLAVAEFGNDQNGEMAHRLKTAIEYVADACRLETIRAATEAQAKTETKRPPDDPAGPQPDAPERYE